MDDIPSELIQRAMEGDAVAQFNAGEYCLHNLPDTTWTEREEEEKVVAEWFVKAAAQGHQGAIDWLLKESTSGDFGSFNPIVQRGLEERAEHGDAQCQYVLGRGHFDGDCVDQDFNKAARWIAKAAEQGHVDAMSELSGVRIAQRAIDLCPKPKTCSSCGESKFYRPTISANARSVKWKCFECNKTVTLLVDSNRGTQNSSTRRPIPKEVQREAWRRDQG